MGGGVPDDHIDSCAGNRVDAVDIATEMACTSNRVFVEDLSTQLKPIIQKCVPKRRTYVVGAAFVKGLPRVTR